MVKDVLGEGRGRRQFQLVAIQELHGRLSHRDWFAGVPVVIFASHCGPDALLLLDLLTEGVLEDLIDSGAMGGPDPQDLLDQVDLALLYVTITLQNFYEKKMHFFISPSTSSEVSPLKGALPSIISNSKIPKAQMSILWSYCCFWIISGAMYS